MPRAGTSVTRRGLEHCGTERLCSVLREEESIKAEPQDERGGGGFLLAVTQMTCWTAINYRTTFFALKHARSNFKPAIFGQSVIA